MVYPRIMRWMHWIMALLMITLLCVGLWMANWMPEEVSYRWQVYGLHKSFGVIIAFLIVLRVIVRWRSTLPPLPDSIKTIDKKASMAGHLGLYFLMIGMPVSGVVMSQAGGYPVAVFGYQLPVLIAENKALGGLAHSMHSWLGYIGCALVLTHIAAVIKHKIIDKTSLLIRMRLP